jgi:hypothetical protein
MPWKSAKQAAWGHSPAGLKALGGAAKVAEWDASTPKGSLKPRVGKTGYKAKVGRKMSLKEVMAAK